MSTKLFTFKGGVHPPHSKSLTQNVPIEDAKAPDIVVIPLSQHIGAPCDPLVAVGDTVKVGQKNWRIKSLCFGTGSFKRVRNSKKN